MASTYVNDLRLNELATGDASGTWGTITNTNLEHIAEAFIDVDNQGNTREFCPWSIQETTSEKSSHAMLEALEEVNADCEVFKAFPRTMR